MQALNVASDTQRVLPSVDATEAFYSTKSSFFENLHKIAYSVLGLLICIGIVFALIGFAPESKLSIDINSDVPDVQAMDAWMARNTDEPIADEMLLSLADKDVTHVRKVVLTSGIVNDLINQFNKKQISFFVLKPDATNPEVLTHIVKGSPTATFEDFKSKFSNDESSIGLINFKTGRIERPIVVIISPDLTSDVVTKLYSFPDPPSKIPVPGVHIFFGRTTNTLFKENLLIYARDVRISAPVVNSYLITKSDPNNAAINPITYTELFNQFKLNRVGFLLFSEVDRNTVKVTITPPTTPFNVFVDQLEGTVNQLGFIKVGPKTVALASSFTQGVPQLLTLFNIPNNAKTLTATYGISNVYTFFAQTKYSVTAPFLQASAELLK